MFAAMSANNVVVARTSFGFGGAEGVGEPAGLTEAAGDFVGEGEPVLAGALHATSIIARSRSGVRTLDTGRLPELSRMNLISVMRTIIDKTLGVQ
jgi:hypothetical protein